MVGFCVLYKYFEIWLKFGKRSLLFVLCGGLKEEIWFLFVLGKFLFGIWGILVFFCMIFWIMWFVVWFGCFVGCDWIFVWDMVDRRCGCMVEIWGGVLFGCIFCYRCGIVRIVFWMLFCLLLDFFLLSLWCYL